MDLDIWKSGVEKHLPVLEAFVKKVLLRNSKVTLANTTTVENENAAGQLKETAIIVYAEETNLETELLFGFSETWTTLLAKAILNVDESQNNEFTKDMFKEFINNLLTVIEKSFQEIGVELDFNNIAIIKSGQIKRSLDMEHYFSAEFEVEPTFEMEGDSDEQALGLTVLMGHPNKEKVEEVANNFDDENPFLNEKYIAISAKNAGSTNLNRVEQQQKNEDPIQIKSNINTEGKKVEFENFNQSSTVNNNAEVRNIDMLKNVKMNLSVELGRREMPLGEILQLVKGSVIELEKLAGEPVEILVNGQKIAQGDVVVIDEQFGVRISNLLATQEHLRELS